MREKEGDSRKEEKVDLTEMCYFFMVRSTL